MRARTQKLLCDERQTIMFHSVSFDKTQSLEMALLESTHNDAKARCVRGRESESQSQRHAYRHQSSVLFAVVRYTESGEVIWIKCARVYLAYLWLQRALHSTHVIMYIFSFRGLATMESRVHLLCPAHSIRRVFLILSLIVRDFCTQTFRCVYGKVTAKLNR